MTRCLMYEAPLIPIPAFAVPKRRINQRFNSNPAALSAELMSAARWRTDDIKRLRG